jgi:hypothetical protein
MRPFSVKFSLGESEIFAFGKYLTAKQFYLLEEQFTLMKKGARCAPFFII